MENIQVAVRVRPLLPKESENNETIAWKINTPNLKLINRGNLKAKEGRKKDYVFDDVFGPDETNEEVYDRKVQRVAQSCLEGYNGTIFMYGQTGSGKTYTMLGYKNEDGLYNDKGSDSPDKKQSPSDQKDVSSPAKNGDSLDDEVADLAYENMQASSLMTNSGILIQSLKDIFKQIENDDQKTFFLKCSYFEIYNDQIYDLLKPRSEINTHLILMENVKRDTFSIKGLTEVSVASVKEIIDKLKLGEINRHYAATHMNHSSSRSHTLFRITVKAVTNDFIRKYRQKGSKASNINNKDLLREQEGTIVTESFLNFVDLAGSERISSHDKSKKKKEDESVITMGKNPEDQVAIDRKKEGKSINKSLFFLTRVISLKAEGKSNAYIPFRNSPLTKILRSSLGGNFRTLVILCVNPSDLQLEHSVSTLRFGTNAKKIRNKVRANIVTNNDNESIRILIENYEKKIKDLENQRVQKSDKNGKVFKLVSDLQIQRVSLLERLEEANKKLNIKFASEIPQSDLSVFFKDMKSRTGYFAKAGIVFVPEALRKYDDMRAMQAGSDSKEDWKKRFTNELSSKEIINKVAFTAYQKAKGQQDDLKYVVEKQKKYILDLYKTYQSVCNFVTTMADLGSTYLLKLEQIVTQFQDEYLLSNERQIKLEFYEKFKGMTLLSDKDLNKMDAYVDEFREAIQNEKDRREILKRKTNELPGDVIDSLRRAANEEREEQEEQMGRFQDKIEHFSQFKEGCISEIDYYREIYKEFNEKTRLGIKYEELEDYLKGDFQAISKKLRQTDGTFKKFDKELDQNNEHQLKAKIAEFQNKFEKLVDRVLSSENQKGQEEAAVSKHKTPTKSRTLMRSNSVNFDVTPVSTSSLKKVQPDVNNKIKNWFDIRKIENEKFNYAKVLEDAQKKVEEMQEDQEGALNQISEDDDESVINSAMGGGVGGGGSEMIGNKKQSGKVKNPLGILGKLGLKGANKKTVVPKISNFDIVSDQKAEPEACVNDEESQQQVEFTNSSSNIERGQSSRREKDLKSKRNKKGATAKERVKRNVPSTTFGGVSSKMSYSKSIGRVPGSKKKSSKKLKHNLNSSRNNDPKEIKGTDFKTQEDTDNGVQNSSERVSVRSELEQLKKEQNSNQKKGGRDRDRQTGYTSTTTTTTVTTALETETSESANSKQRVSANVSSTDLTTGTARGKGPQSGQNKKKALHGTNFMKGFDNLRNKKRTATTTSSSRYTSDYKGGRTSAADRIFNKVKKPNKQGNQGDQSCQLYY